LKRNLRKVMPVIIALVISISLITWSVKSHIQEASSPSPTVPADPLQLGDLQTHTFQDLGFSIAYPSDWTKLESATLSPVTIQSKEKCWGLPLVISAFRPYTIGSNGFQASINDSLSLYVQMRGGTIVQKSSVTYGGLSFIEAIISDNSSFDHEIWDVSIFLLSEDGYRYSLTSSYCTPDCWEYYEDAVYTITSTYQFLD
jgi:hypothetical protein